MEDRYSSLVGVELADAYRTAFCPGTYAAVSRMSASDYTVDSSGNFVQKDVPSLSAQATMCKEAIDATKLTSVYKQLKLEKLQHVETAKVIAESKDAVTAAYTKLMAAYGDLVNQLISNNALMHKEGIECTDMGEPVLDTNPIEKYVANRVSALEKRLYVEKEKIRTYNEDMAELLKPIHLAISQDKDLSSEKNEEPDAVRCTICCTNKVSLVFDPCGHTSCNECKAVVLQQNSFRDSPKCHICRTTVTKCITMYI